MDNMDYIGILALSFSFLAFALSIWNSLANKRMTEANLYLSRYSGLETNLVLWSDAFKLYGVDLEQAKKEDVTVEMIVYLILFINSISAECQFLGVDITTELARPDGTLKRRFLSNPESIKTWKYAQNNFGDDVVKEIDTFISSVVLSKSSKATPKTGAL